MKTNIKNIAIAMFILSTAIFGCKKDAIKPIDGTNSAIVEEKIPDPVLIETEGEYGRKSVAGVLMKGRWEILSFVTEGQYGTNNTERFRGYLFRFEIGNLVVAEKNGKGVAGKWNVYVEKGVTKVVLNFGVQPLIELNDTWNQLSYTPVYVRLQKKGPEGMIHLDFRQIKEKPQITK